MSTGTGSARTATSAAIPATPALPSTMPALLDEADLAYVSCEFATLGAVCAGRGETPETVRRLMAGGQLPRPTYLLPDGERVPADYFALVDAAGDVDRLPVWFAAELTRELAARDLDSSPGRVALEWDGYLSGEYGACLRQVTPANIAEKARLMRAIEAALERPRPGQLSWRRPLRDSVDRLDAILRRFAAWDRRRFGGPVSRDRLITAVRQRFSDFATDE
jgi:hypothetical protein